MRKNVTTFIALRYMKANYENRFFSWIAMLAIVGITISVAAMIVVLSVITGFEEELRNRFLAANAHVLAYRYPTGLKDYEGWTARFAKDYAKDISGVAPFVHMETMARSKATLHQMLIKGIAPRPRENVQPLHKLVRPPSALDILQNEIDSIKKGFELPAEPSIIVGSGLARLLSIKAGDMLEVVSPSTEGPYGSFKMFKVAGIYDSGLKHYDNRLGLVSIPAAQALFKMPKNIATGVEIGMLDPDTSEDLADRIAEDHPNIYVKHWKNYNRGIFEAMEKEKVVIGSIVFLVAIVASFNILTTLFVSVTQKQKDISILKALGATNSQINGLFLKQSIYIGTLGGIGGVILAFILSKILEHYQFIDLPDIYLLAALPVTYDWQLYLGVSIVAIFLCIIAALGPAIVATRFSPTEGLRKAES